MPRGYACRIDDNHTEIVSALKTAGATVIDTARLGAGFPDLILGFNGRTVLMEIKNPKTQYGRAGLNKTQLTWHANWRGGTLATVDGIEAALRVLKVMAA